MRTINTIEFIEQIEKNECGYACLTMLFNYFNYDITLSQLRKEYGTVKGGISFQDMKTICTNYGINSNAYKINPNDINELNNPGIIQWNNNTHFVILHKISKNQVSVIDPAYGELKLSIKDFYQTFNGKIFIIESENKIHKKKHNFNMLDAFFNSMKKNLNLFICMFILSAVLLLASIIPTYILSRLIDQLIKYKTINTKWFGIAIMASILLFLLHYFKEQTKVALTNCIEYDLTSTYIDKLFKVPLSFFENRKKGDLINRFYMLSQIRDLFTTQIVSVALNIIIIIAYSLILFSYSIPLGLAIVMWICSIVILVSILVNESYKLSKKTLLSQIEIQNLVAESISLIHDIKVFSLEKIMFDKWEKIFGKFIKIRKTSGSFKSVVSALLIALQTFQPFFVFGIGCIYLINQTMSFGVLYYIMMISEMITEPVISTCSIYMNMFNYGIIFQRLADTSSIESENSLCLTDDLYYHLEGKIEFRNVSFRYSKFEPPIFQNISFTIFPKENVYLQGHSGCGKSTLIKLILGEYSISSGQIYIDDVPITRYDIRILRKSIAIVPQDGMLFNTTILENIILNEKFEKNKFNKILEEVKLAEIINRFPQKENTIISENGIDFSKGQRQRILLARAIYKNAAILILDEATNCLQKESEKSILRNILAKEKTIIVISHTIDTLDFDKTLQIKDNGNLCIC